MLSDEYNLYNYVGDTNAYIDAFGLAGYKGRKNKDGSPSKKRGPKTKGQNGPHNDVIGKKAKEYTLLAIQDKSDKEKLYRATERISVVHQMENLLTFPDVERKIKDGSLQIHGWYYRIEDGTLESYDGEECSFLPLVEDINGE